MFPTLDATEILHGSVEINEIPTRPQLDENESCRQDEGPIFHDLSYGFSGQDTQETKVTDMQYKVTSKSEKTEHPDSGMQHDADEQDVESASPASQQPFLSLLVLPLAVLII
ncbi:hypothetical protein X801_09992 [Opisthorchis viverrini]|uniref:Uncharacterized protein n=1 Tax=Opisthorchis viverrini TaxID=6198 RepID=A0A1S8WIF8_OPIVI|nr:hypothetical protein X801_09992 [Opisthorchis viverrini]